MRLADRRGPESTANPQHPIEFTGNQFFAMARRQQSGEHLRKAERLIEETGYHRRHREVEELRREMDGRADTEATAQQGVSGDAYPAGTIEDQSQTAKKIEPRIVPNSDEHSNIHHRARRSGIEGQAKHNATGRSPQLRPDD